MIGSLWGAHGHYPASPKKVPVPLVTISLKSALYVAYVTAYSPSDHAFAPVGNLGRILQ